MYRIWRIADVGSLLRRPRRHEKLISREGVSDSVGAIRKQLARLLREVERPKSPAEERTWSEPGLNLDDESDC